VELKYCKNKYGQDCIGEVNGKNQLNGKGIQFNEKDEWILIGYFKNGSFNTPGNFVFIYYGGEDAGILMKGKSFWGTSG
jgi:hypothetical protein